MAAATGIWNQATAAQAFPSVTAKNDASGDTTSSSSDDSATISANDFLTLLVTEMQNQDPTADTDPNEYINQLVNVNSLEQLISMNQTLTTAFPGSSSTSGSNTPTGGSENPAAGSEAHAKVASIAAALQAPAQAYGSIPVSAQGNLSIPEAKPAAQRVAQSLSGMLPTR